MIVSVIMIPAAKEHYDTYMFVKMKHDERSRRHYSATAFKLQQQFYSPNPTILLRLTLLMKDKKKGSQPSAVFAESLEPSDFKPFRTCYLSLRAIATTVSTCVESLRLLEKMPFNICH